MRGELAKRGPPGASCRASTGSAGWRDDSFVHHLGARETGFFQVQQRKDTGAGKVSVSGSGSWTWAEARGWGWQRPPGRENRAECRENSVFPPACGICVLSAGITQAPTHALLDTRSGGETAVTRGVPEGQQLWVMVTRHGVALELGGRSGEEEPRGPWGPARRGRGAAESYSRGRTELLRRDGLWKRMCAWPRLQGVTTVDSDDGRWLWLRGCTGLNSVTPNSCPFWDLRLQPYLEIGSLQLWLVKMRPCGSRAGP